MLKKIHHSSPNFEPRPKGTSPDMIILHYTDMTSAQDALARLCDLQSRVSAHFLISKEGTLYQLVDPVHRAWHAGDSSWQEIDDINSRSIGIELDNLGHTFGPEPFPDCQIKTLLDLLKELIVLYKIPPHAILGHSDVAPLRKKDPGELFPWKLLASKGFGIWPSSMEFASNSSSMSILEIQEALSRIGYLCPQTGVWDEDSQKVCYAFQQHFIPHELTAYPTELTKLMLRAVVARSGDIGNRLCRGRVTL